MSLLKKQKLPPWLFSVGDTVLITKGREADIAKKGKIINCFIKDYKVTVEGINMVHTL